MNIRLILILLFISNVAMAKSVWINVVGLSKDHIGSNFISFYQSAEYFVKICQTSLLKPECKMFLDNSVPVNDDISKVVKSLNLPITEAPVKKNILAYLSTAIANSQPNDTIILNLTGHGAPDKLKGNSCSLISADEKICETDLVDIVKAKKKGVILFINAEGCFSGAFADISTSETCVATRVDRRSGAVSSEGFIWELITKKKIKKLTDFGSILGDKYSQIPVLASVQMKNLICSDFRINNYKNWPKAATFFDDDKTVQDYFRLINKNTDFYVNNFLDQITDDIFEQYPMFLKNKILGFIEFRNEAKNFKCNQTFNKEFCASFDYFFSQDVDMKINKLLQLAKQIEISKKSEQKRIFNQFKKQYIEFYSGKELQSWKQIEPCFFDMENSITPEEAEYFNEHKFIGENFPVKYNQKSIDEAKSCETKVIFNK